MTATFKEYVFDFSDLHLLSAVCGKCKSEMILDMKEAFTKMPKSCSSCGNDFDPMFTEALNSFHVAYDRFTAKSARASARIRIRREVNMAEF